MYDYRSNNYRTQPVSLYYTTTLDFKKNLLTRSKDMYFLNIGGKRAQATYMPIKSSTIVHVKQDTK